MEFILGWRVWTSEVPRCHSSLSPTRDPIQGSHIPHVLPASVFPSESPKARVTCSIFMCRQRKLEPDMLYARGPSVPSLLYKPPSDLTYQRACRWGKEGRRRQSKHNLKVGLLLQMLNDPGKQSQMEQAWISRLLKSLGALERSDWVWTQAIRV